MQPKYSDNVPHSLKIFKKSFKIFLLTEKKKKPTIYFEIGEYSLPDCCESHWVMTLEYS